KDEDRRALGLIERHALQDRRLAGAVLADNAHQPDRGQRVEDLVIDHIAADPPTAYRVPDARQGVTGFLVQRVDEPRVRPVRTDRDAFNLQFPRDGRAVDAATARDDAAGHRRKT